MALPNKFVFLHFLAYVYGRQTDIVNNKCRITIAYQENSLGHQQNPRVDTSTKEPANSTWCIQITKSKKPKLSHSQLNPGSMTLSLSLHFKNIKMLRKVSTPITYLDIPRPHNHCTCKFNFGPYFSKG
jgi:hypothetical protein